MTDAHRHDPDHFADSATSPSPADSEPMLFCPVCSNRLSERKCKLFCEQCGYYLSCADYY